MPRAKKQKEAEAKLDETGQEPPENFRRQDSSEVVRDGRGRFGSKKQTVEVADAQLPPAEQTKDDDDFDFPKLEEDDAPPEQSPQTDASETLLDFSQVESLTEKHFELLKEKGIESVNQLAESNPESVAEILDLSLDDANAIWSDASEIIKRAAGQAPPEKTLRDADKDGNKFLPGMEEIAHPELEPLALKLREIVNKRLSIQQDESNAEEILRKKMEQVGVAEYHFDGLVVKLNVTKKASVKKDPKADD